MSKQPTYKEALQTALDCLEEAEGHTMSAIFNIAFAGTYREIGRLHEEGEMLQLEAAAFEDTGDANVDLVLKLVYEINSVMDSIRNLNNLEDREAGDC